MHTHFHFAACMMGVCINQTCLNLMQLVIVLCISWFAAKRCMLSSVVFQRQCVRLKISSMCWSELFPLSSRRTCPCEECPALIQPLMEVLGCQCSSLCILWEKGLTSHLYSVLAVHKPFPSDPLDVNVCVDSSSSSRLSTFLMLPTDPRSSCPLTPRGCSPQASLQSQAQDQVCWRWGLWAARHTCQSKMRRTTMTWSTEVTRACNQRKPQQMSWSSTLMLW